MNIHQTPIKESKWSQWDKKIFFYAFSVHLRNFEIILSFIRFPFGYNLSFSLLAGPSLPVLSVYHSVQKLCLFLCLAFRRSFWQYLYLLYFSLSRQVFLCLPIYLYICPHCLLIKLKKKTLTFVAWKFFGKRFSNFQCLLVKCYGFSMPQYRGLPCWKEAKHLGKLPLLRPNLFLGDFFMNAGCLTFLEEMTY